MLSEADLDKIRQLKKRLEVLGATDDIVERYGEYDIAYPVTEEEYCGLRGNAIVMIMAIAKNCEELPLARVYYRTEAGEEADLTKLVSASDITKTKFPECKNDYFMNIGFWLFPVYLVMEGKGAFNLDFKERRNRFSLKFDPWPLDKRIVEHIRKQLAGIIKIPELWDNDILMKFLNREFGLPT